MTSEAMRNGNKQHFENLLFSKKGHSKQKGRCPDTLDTPSRSAPAYVALILTF